MAATERQFQVYIVTCLTTGKRYVGRCSDKGGGWRRRWRDHVYTAGRDSRTALHCAVRKYGPDTFDVWHVASAATWAAVGEAEKALIAQEGTLAPAGYNLTEGGDGTFGHRHSQEAKRKISEASTRLMRSRPELTSALVASRKKLVWTEAQGAAWSALIKGAMNNPVTRAKISTAVRESSKNPETHRRRMAALAKRAPITEATRAKMSVAASERNKRRTPETYAKAAATRSRLRYLRTVEALLAA